MVTMNILYVDSGIIPRIVKLLHHGHLSDVLSFLPDALKPPKSLTVLVVGNKATIRWLIDETSETISHF
jgi:hypothetical protein